ncbi:hypothetical protein M0813_16722 [Anaeramoeba flamelloides]|uniref:Uncharacterized protein n=1 Tax=Anaeramoeba flamelloides TaxID=1746091 RepID=A0ABQ8YZI0_9EUKA|nr:hypothetical protein M0813_16722 [Anaeramoeba flamelloides]
MLPFNQHIWFQTFVNTETVFDGKKPTHRVPTNALNRFNKLIISLLLAGIQTAGIAIRIFCSVSLTYCHQLPFGPEQAVVIANSQFQFCFFLLI